MATYFDKLRLYVRGMPRWVPLALAGGGGLALVASMAGKRKVDAPGDFRFTSEDIEYLSRIALVEAGASDVGRGEWAAIMWVAVNRARTNYGGRGTAIRDQVDTPKWFGSAGVGYNKIHTEEGLPDRESKARKDARDIARGVLSGTVRNPIGSRLSFTHCGAMKRCDEVGRAEGETSEKMICYDHPVYGLRWLPKWIVPKSAGGLAKNEPVTVNRATFA